VRDASQIIHLAKQLYPSNTKFFQQAYELATKDPYSYLFVDLTPTCPDVWFDTIKLKPKTAKKLAPHSMHIKFAADKRNHIVKRRARLVQKGEGFLPFLLTSVLEQLANFL
jgi:hypothetical protein